ncbi:MAG: hypothetical protein KME15_16870 [Drouetiella hepatica Uher 2000/2452]|jgi:lipopolysaccharide export LptBFGC system permease protein LptF|uniref:DUF4175 domain-containing protein n=1 Tax=Drouetiella hepatica Uher 2000/2452 TaxID=904376 RepID=A0A951UP00_9CYAN|nr:hypothetical protein [Drouetiella hepatica Uher 2000/2452]
MTRILRPTTTVFLALLGVATALWILRGFGLLTFLPGGILWVLMLLTIGAGVVSGLQWTKR